MSGRAISDGTRWAYYGAAGLITPPDPPTPPWAPIMTMNFSRVSAGAMTGARWRTLTGDPAQPGSYAGYNRMSVVEDNDRGRVCRIDFTGGRANGSSPVAESIVMFIPLPMGAYPGGFAAGKDRAVRMTDWMLFPTDYTFPPGLKTPGMGANIGAASEGQASGGKGEDPEMIEALSLRPMPFSAPAGAWSPGVPGFGSVLTGRNNRLTMYSYFYGMNQGYGRDHWGPDPGAPGHWPSTRVGDPARARGDGKWHKRTLVMIPNTRTGSTWNADGGIRFYLDDVLIHKVDNLPWRSNPNLWINKYWWHHFEGGSGNAWAVPDDQHYLYDGPVIEWALFDGWPFD